MASAPRRRPGRHGRWAGPLVGSGLVAFVGATYFAFVVGLGSFIREDEGSANIALSALATAIVAVGFEPVRTGLHRLAKLARPGTSSPEDVQRDAVAALARRADRLRAELACHKVELAERSRALQRSGRRLATAATDERTRLERDIHDGAQQRLVAMTVNLRLAQRLITADPERAARLLDEQAFAAHAAIESLGQLCRGIHPRSLVDQGLASALQSATASGPLRVLVTDRSMRRPAADVEAALYFCCLEALQNAAKHADATQARVEIDSPVDGEIRMVVVDDGRGFDPNRVRNGAGLANMRYRIGAVGGRLDLRSGPAAGVRVEVRVPSYADPTARAG